MKYLVVDAFPEGEYHIPLLNEPIEEEQEELDYPVFDTLEGAEVFSDTLQNGIVLPLSGLKEIEALKSALREAIDLAHELSEVSSEEFNSFSKVKELKSYLDE